VKTRYLVAAVTSVLILVGYWCWQPRDGNTLLKKLHIPVTKSMSEYASRRAESVVCGAAWRGELQAMVDCGDLLSSEYRNRGRDDQWARTAQGIALLRRAAEQGHAEAEYEMGRQAEDRKEYAEAFRWYLKSATQGYSDAKSSVAFAYLLGQGTEQNDDDAQHWFYESVYDGDPMAAQVLGDMFRESKMPAVSYRWYRIAECASAAHLNGSPPAFFLAPTSVLRVMPRSKNQP
jgi:TPR repeat protein